MNFGKLVEHEINERRETTAVNPHDMAKKYSPVIGPNLRENRPTGHTNEICAANQSSLNDHIHFLAIDLNRLNLVGMKKAGCANQNLWLQ